MHVVCESSYQNYIMVIGDDSSDDSDDDDDDDDVD